MMKKSKRRRLFIVLKVFLAFCLISFTWGWISYFRSGETFVGSPASRGIKRNNLNLNSHGTWLGKYGEQFRTRSYSDIGPALFAVPIVQYFKGWDEYNDSICVQAKILNLEISASNGDIQILVLLGSNQAHYSSGRLASLTKRNLILVRIGDSIRKNFPIIPDLAIGDIIKVCGHWGYNRATLDNEIYPARWVEIIEMNNGL